MEIKKNVMINLYTVCVSMRATSTACGIQKKKKTCYHALIAKPKQRTVAILTLKILSTHQAGIHIDMR